VDGEPGSAGALRYAVAEAQRRRTQLRVVHVVPAFLSVGTPVPLNDLHQIGVEILGRAVDTVAELAPDLAVTTELAHGDRSAGVVAAAKGAQLLVVGRETRRGVERLLTGTATAGIAAHAPCDVAVVPSFWSEGPSRGRVVVGLKRGHHAEELLGEAFAEAHARDASLVVVTAWQLADPYFDRVEERTHEQEWQAHGRTVILEATADLRTTYPDVTVEARVVHGPAARVLLDVSEGSDLLVISRRRFSMPPYGRLGSVGHDVLRLSEVPVLVVPYAAEPAADTEGLVLEQAGAAVK
jgi:nucleotide-binding universal stress UspA family protein